MMDRTNFFFCLDRALVQLRISGSHSSGYGFKVEVRDLIWRGMDESFITYTQAVRLFELSDNAFEHCEDVRFPNQRNAGPFMPTHVWYERHLDQIKAFEAEHFHHEKPESVPAPTSPTRLRLLCLRSQKTGAYQPVATLRPMPPRSLFSGRWCHGAEKRSLVSDRDFLPLGLGLYLSPTLAHATPAEVLARGSRHRQTNPVRPALGSARAGGLSHAR